MEEKLELEKIKSAFDLNQLIVSQCAMYLNHTPDAMNSQLISEITNGDTSLEEGSIAMFLANIFCEDENEANKLCREYYKKMIKCLSPEEYKNDPYYKNIKIPEAKSGKWALKNQEYKPYELFVCADLEIDGYREMPQLGYFRESFSFPTVFENGIEWMAIKPNEIETMKGPIREAHGNVLVLGLGLGYYTYMISEKENVDSITVVERDKSVIELFENQILPQFKNKHKITVVCMDAFDYMENNAREKKFDFQFADLWHDISDGTELYLKLRKKEFLSPRTEYSYWIEKSILSGIRANIFSAIYESINNGKLKKSIDEIHQMLTLNYIKELARYI